MRSVLSRNPIFRPQLMAGMYMKNSTRPTFWVSFAMFVGVMGTALASPLYPLYHDAWQLQPSHITGIYVVYMVGVLISLLFLTRLTDRLGFMPMLRVGLIMVTAGIALSAVAWDLNSLAVSRLLIGMASGLITTSAAVGLIGLNPYRDPQLVSAITSLAMACGFGAGPLVGGLMAQWAPAPLTTTYLPSLTLSVLAIYGLFRLNIPASQDRRPFDLRALTPRITMPPREVRGPFWLASIGAFSTFAVFGLYASLAPSFMEQMLPWNGPAISGTFIALILMLSATVQWFARALRPLQLVIWAMRALCVSCLLLLVTAATSSPWLFMLSVLATAIGHGMGNLSGVAIVNRVSTGQTRAGLFSSYLMVGYMGSIVPILAVGWIADHYGLKVGIEVFCVTLATLALTLAASARRVRRKYQVQVVPA